jgi:hypothetical protein
MLKLMSRTMEPVRSTNVWVEIFDAGQSVAFSGRRPGYHNALAAVPSVPRPPATLAQVQRALSAEVLYQRVYLTLGWCSWDVKSALEGW